MLSTISFPFPLSSLPFPSLPFPSLLTHHMTKRLFKKGKRKRSPSSSDTDDDSHLISKRSHLSSPARVRQAALVKVKAKSGSSESSKGLASFAALVNNANLSAARAETNRGLRSSKFRENTGTAKSREERMVSLV